MIRLLKIKVVACGLLLCGQVIAQQESVRIKVVHTNDTHSCVMPIHPNSADTAQADKGGFLRRVAVLKELRKEDPDLLLFDCGDFSQGSAYYNLYKGEVEIKLMNVMRYDAATIGNHEFDCGLENLARIYRIAEFPIVCANYDVKGTCLEDCVKPFVVLHRKGLKIGVLGLGANLEGLVAQANYEGVGFEDPIAVANKVATYLKEEERCDVVICLSHLGWEIDGVDDSELIPQSRHIDIVLGGHSHSYFEQPVVMNNADGKPVYCNQMGKNARYVGTLTLEFTPFAE